MSGPYSRVCLLVWSLRLWSLRYENKVAKVEYTTYQQAEGCALLLGVAPAPGLRVHGCGDARRAHALPKLLVTKHVNRSPYSTKKGGKRPPTLFLFLETAGTTYVFDRTYQGYSLETIIFGSIISVPLPPYPFKAFCSPAAQFWTQIASGRFGFRPARLLPPIDFSSITYAFFASGSQRVSRPHAYALIYSIDTVTAQGSAPRE